MKKNKSWVIVEMEIIDGEEKFKSLAGTEDRKAINAALAALKDYKDRCIQLNQLDLTEIRTSVIQELNPVNQVISQDEDDSADRLMSMVDCD